MKALLQTRFGRMLVTPAVLIALGFQGIAFANPANADCLSVDYMNALAPSDGVYETCGGDDLSYRIPINGTVIFGGNTYSQIYATNNSIITFGQPDYEFSNFPQTPSISLDAYDWVERGFFAENGTQYPIYNPNNQQFETSTARTDEYFKITVAGNTFRVDIAARPFGTYAESLRNSTPDGAPRLMSLYFVRNSNGTLSIRSFTSNSADPNLRNGCVLTQGAIAISLEDCGIYEVLTLEEIIRDIPKDLLVAISPLKIKQNSTQVICEAAKLQYMEKGVIPTDSKLSKQVYALKLDGKVIAESATLDGQAVFDKKDIPTEGYLGCSQTAYQGSTYLTLESYDYRTLAPAALVRKNAIAEAKKKYFATLQSLGNAKKDALRESVYGDGSVDYQAASEKWKSAVVEAEAELDAAVAKANQQETTSLEKDGIRLNYKK